MSVYNDIETARKQLFDDCPGAYIVTYYDIYDQEHSDFIIGVASTYDNAVDMIKDEIKNISCCYHSYRFSIEHWALDKRYMGGLTESFTKEQNIEWAKELGVYYD